MATTPTTLEQWFKVATFVLGFTLVMAMLVHYWLRGTTSWELLAVGASAMGLPAFINFDRKINGR